MYRCEWNEDEIFTRIAVSFTSILFVNESLLHGAERTSIPFSNDIDCKFLQSVNFWVALAIISDFDDFPREIKRKHNLIHFV